jgi:hypothetical protein
MLKKLVFKPTVNKESTPYTTEGAWVNTDKVRFVSGYPQIIGGWSQISNSAGGIGVPRSLRAWTLLDGTGIVGIGSNLSFYAFDGTTRYNITPVRKTSVLLNAVTTVVSTLSASCTSTDTTLFITDTTDFAPFGTVLIGTETISYRSKAVGQISGCVRGFFSTPAAHTAGDQVVPNGVIVTDVAHGAISFTDTPPGIIPNLSFECVPLVSSTGISAAVGGAPIGSYAGDNFTIIYRDPNTYWLLGGTNATSGATGGGNITITYCLNPGRVTANGTTQPMIWNQQNYGQNLVFGQKGSELYYWDPLLGLGTKGVLLSTLAGSSGIPTKVESILVTESRFLVAFGCTPLGSAVFDPMLIRWSDQELIQDFTPTATNLAGELRLSKGTRIVTALETKEEILIWTDTALYSMQALSDSQAFGVKLIADNISIAGPNAAIVANNMVFWMGRDKFYQYTGRSETLPCSIRQYVFGAPGTSNVLGGMYLDQQYQVYAGLNPQFSEVWWFYPGIGQDGYSLDSTSPPNTGLNNCYAAYNYLDNAWTNGTMQRSAWLYTGLYPYPLAANQTYTYADVLAGTANTRAFRLMYHEYGLDDNQTGTPAAINALIQSGDFDIDDGDRFGFVRRILPDFSFFGTTNPNAEVDIAIYPKDNSGGNTSSAETLLTVVGGTYPDDTYTGALYARIRGRQMRLLITSVVTGIFWQLGALRIDVKPDGKRG